MEVEVVGGVLVAWYVVGVWGTLVLQCTFILISHNQVVALVMLVMVASNTGIPITVTPRTGVCQL